MAANTAAAPKHLPKTASSLPLLAFTGFASLLAALALTVRRRGARA
jgi:LPXTG-motif cell wall-anchored protein